MTAGELDRRRQIQGQGMVIEGHSDWGQDEGQGKTQTYKERQTACLWQEKGVRLDDGCILQKHHTTCHRLNRISGSSGALSALSRQIHPG